MKTLKITGYIIFTIALMIVVNTRQASAQLAGLQSIYFENQYLANPAMAGIEKGLNLNLGYQQQWTTTPGSPKLQDFTADYNAGNHVGLGFMINNDDAGLISRTRIMGTYAYHLPVSEESKLSFGLSFGINDSYIDYSKVNGDQGDASVALFNQRRVYADGDLGVSYTSKGLNLQAALPNLNSTFFNTEGTNLDVDRATFYTAASYKFPLDAENDNFTLEPKVAFRGVKGYDDIGDIGGNVVMKEYGFNISALYHTNQSFSVGIGIDLKPIHLLFSYTNNTGPLSTYANNTFEFGVKYMLFK